MISCIGCYFFGSALDRRLKNHMTKYHIDAQYELQLQKEMSSTVARQLQQNCVEREKGPKQIFFKDLLTDLYCTFRQTHIMKFLITVSITHLKQGLRLLLRISDDASLCILHRAVNYVYITILRCCKMITTDLYHVLEGRNECFKQ